MKRRKSLDSPNTLGAAAQRHAAPVLDGRASAPAGLTKIETTLPASPEPRRGRTERVPHADVLAAVRPADRDVLAAALEAIRPDGTVAAQEERELRLLFRRLSESTPTPSGPRIGEAFILAASEPAAKSAWRCGQRIDRNTGWPWRCRSRGCRRCRRADERRWRDKLVAQAAVDIEFPPADRWLALCLTFGRSWLFGRAQAQAAASACFARFVALLRDAFGLVDYCRVIVVSRSGWPHEHAILRAPGIVAAMVAESGAPWSDLAAAPRCAVGLRFPSLRALVASLAREAGFGRSGFYVAPVADLPKWAGYITQGQVKHGRGPLIKGLRLIQASAGFHADPGTVRRVRRDATNRNAPGDSDVDDG